MSKKSELKSGTIERVFFQRIGFSAGLIRLEDSSKLEKFAGNTFALHGRKVTLAGHYAKNKYGKYFSVQYVEPEFVMDSAGLIKYLAMCPEVRGIGLSKAEKIIANFDSKFEKTLFEKPELISAFAKLPDDSFKELQIKWKESKGWNQVYAWLASFDLSYFQIENLVKSLGSECPFLLKKDPYALIELVSGIGFIRMDEIALKLGFDKKFSGRLSGALKYTTLIQLKNGHCWTEASELQQTALKILSLDDPKSEEIIDNAITQNVENGTFLYYPLGNRKGIAIGLSKIAEYEHTLSEVFNNQGTSPYAKFFKDLISNNNTNYYDKLTLNKRQRIAVNSALESNVRLLHIPYD